MNDIRQELTRVFHQLEENERLVLTKLEQACQQYVELYNKLQTKKDTVMRLLDQHR